MNISNKQLFYTLLMLFVALNLVSCKKYLEAKSDSKLNVPSTLQDLQALLDEFSYMNQNDIGPGEISADNYYLTNTDWAGLSQEGYRRMYTWEKDNLFIGSTTDINSTISNWANAYKPIYIANTVLENIEKVQRNDKNSIEWDNLKGEALFFRAKSFQQIAFIWSPSYDVNTAKTDLGIPLRLTTNINQPSTRSNNQETYDRIVQDLKESSQLLSTTQLTSNPTTRMRPNKIAAFGFLARTYLSMRMYDSCLKYSNICLQLYNTLMNYNNPVSPDFVNPSSTSTPFQQFNPEVIFESIIPKPSPLSGTKAKMDSVLYKMYDANDIRKTAFFRSNGDGTYRWKGNYSVDLFSGIATDEVYLMRAEGYVRGSNISAAMADLNTLLRKRYSGTFNNLIASDANDALNKVLNERRKELPMRGLRWMDIKRLNKDGANITLKRVINGQTYTLPPNDLRYALALPESVLQQTGMSQNPR